MTPSITLLRADARSLPLCDSTVDLIVTGPPYLSLRTRLLQGALIEGDTP